MIKVKEKVKKRRERHTGNEGTHIHYHRAYKSIHHKFERYLKTRGLQYISYEQGCIAGLLCGCRTKGQT
jgi:hypothetical protein